jgi:hypothetical protein
VTHQPDPHTGSHLTRSNELRTCLAWTLNDDLHHANYDQLGHEPDNDLVPMCKPCSKGLHRILERSGHWRAMPRRAATASIITNLRRTRRIAAGDANSA